jgi:MFS family permease
VPPIAVDHWTGVLSSLAFVLGLPLLPFWGVLADRYGRKIIIVRSSVFAAVVYALSAVASNVYGLAFARFLGGFVLGNTGVMMAVQADITPREKLGRAVSIISAGSPVGMAVGPIMGGAIIKEHGVRALLWLDAGLTALVVLALIFFLKDEPREPQPQQSAGRGAIEGLQAILHTPAVLTLFGVTFLLAFGFSIAQPYIPLLVEAVYRGPRADLAPAIGAVLTFAGIAMAVTTPFWGHMGDKTGHLRILRLCSLVVGVAFIGQALSTSLLQLAGLRGAQGVFLGGVGALLMVLLARYSPTSKRSSILTLSLLPQQLSWFLGPLAGTAIAALSLRGVFWAAAITMLIGVAASYRLHPPTAPDEDPAEIG